MRFIIYPIALLAVFLAGCATTKKSTSGPQPVVQSYMVEPGGALFFSIESADVPVTVTAYRDKDLVYPPTTGTKLGNVIEVASTSRKPVKCTVIAKAASVPAKFNLKVFPVPADQYEHR